MPQNKFKSFNELANFNLSQNGRTLSRELFEYIESRLIEEGRYVSLDRYEFSDAQPHSKKAPGYFYDTFSWVGRRRQDKDRAHIIRIGSKENILFNVNTGGETTESFTIRVDVSTETSVYPTIDVTFLPMDDFKFLSDAFKVELRLFCNKFLQQSTATGKESRIIEEEAGLPIKRLVEVI